MDIFEKRYGTARVLEACEGLQNSTLQTWIRRGVIVGHDGKDIDRPGGPGFRRQFDYNQAAQVAVLAALVDAGLSLTHAARAAMRFAHAGDAKRLPGIPVAGEDWTLPCVAGEKSHGVAWKPGQDPMAEIRYVLGRPAGYFVLEINPIFDRLSVALGYHPEAVLEYARQVIQQMNDRFQGEPVSGYRVSDES